MINYENIFEKGILVNLRISCWEGRTKLTEDQMKGLPVEIISGVTDLLIGDEKKSLKEISSHDGKTRSLINNMTIPFPIDGICFVTANKLPDVIKLLTDRKNERMEMINTLGELLEKGMGKFQEKYPDYYRVAVSRGKYPSKDEFERKFRFNWKIFQIAIPNEKSSSFIPSSLFEEEMKKFQNEIETMKEDVINIIYNELLGKAELLKRQSTDGKPNQKTLNSLNEFFGTITNIYSDFIDRDDITNAVKKFKSSVDGVTSEDLRSDEDFKTEFAKQMADMSKGLKALPGTKLKRAIDFS